MLRPGAPFNRPADITQSPRGDLYVADGYRNCRVHRFDNGGHLVQSWGTFGQDPGQVHLLHSVLVGPDGRIYVCDRYNNRVQVFTSNGEFLAVWPGLQHPTDIAVTPEGDFAVSEMEYLDRMTRPCRVHIFDRDGKLLTFWEEPTKDHCVDTRGAHSIAVDSKGDIYVARHQDGVDKYVRLK